MKHLWKRVALYGCLAVLSAGLLSYALGAVKAPSAAGSPTEDEMTDGFTETEFQESPDKNETLTLTAAGYLLSSPFSSLPEGYGLSDGVYDGETYVLTLVTPPDIQKLPGGGKARYTVNYEDEEGNITASAEYFTMWPRMGFIIAADENGREILNASGEILSFPEGYDMVFTGTRDAQNRPRFLEWNSGVSYAVFQDGTLEETSYDPRTDSRGIQFDYPSYYGVTDDPACQVTATRNGFGYRIEEEGSVAASYQKAFAYSEGYGCAYDAQNRLYFFNAEGRLRLAGLASVMYGCGDNNGEQALGYYYFDEGLTRVTKRNYRRGELIDEYETFIDRSGNEFHTPADYSVYSYSNGMILLEKNGLAGYMNSRGRFVCQPSFTYARPFFEGLAVVGDKDGKKGVIDRSGTYVIPPVFDEITDCSGGVICLYDKTCGWQIVNKTAPLPENHELEGENS